MWISGKEFSVEVLKIFTEGMDHGSEEMVGFDKCISWDKPLVKAEVLLRRKKTCDEAPATD